MVVPILARQLIASGWTLFELRDCICNTGLKTFDSSEKTILNKDGIVINATLIGHLRRVFEIVKLNNEKKQVLRNIWWLSSFELDKAEYRVYTNQSSLNPLNELINCGWVQFNNNKLSIHPVVYELIDIDFCPNYSNIPQIINYIYSKSQSLIESGNCDPHEINSLSMILCVRPSENNLQFPDKIKCEQNPFIISFIRKRYMYIRRNQRVPAIL